MKTINILGDTQREQWHGVVNMLQQLGGDLTREGRSSLCDELDRYIDAMEDANTKENEPQKIYALVYLEYVEYNLDGSTWLFSTMEAAQAEMRKQAEELAAYWKLDANNLKADCQHITIENTYAYVHDFYYEAKWRILVEEVIA